MGATLTINRRGRLTLGTDPTTPQCATNGHRDCTYIARVTCRPQLTKDGYLVEHEAIDRAIVDATALPGTCELVAVRAGRAVLDVARREGLDVVSVEVTVTPILPKGQKPMAFISFNWSPE